jgi:hypothetical protein
MESFFENKKHQTEFDKWFEGTVDIKGIKKESDIKLIMCLRIRYKNCGNHKIVNSVVCCKLQLGYCNFQREKA